MYRIIYVKDVEFWALFYDFPASDDKDAQDKVKIEISRLKQQHGEHILILRLERVTKTSDLTERTTKIPF